MKKTIGVIGLGSIGMRHAKNLVAMDHNVIGFDPIMIGDGFASIWPIRRLDEVDGIVIASPTQYHEEHLRMAGLGNKPVFIEKPIGCTPQVSAILALSCEKPVMVGYNLRFHSCVKKAKEWIDAGMIGKPLWANFTLGQFNERPPYLRDGVILNWSHEIDLCLYLLGRADVAASSTRLISSGMDYDNPKLTLRDDMTDILLTHESGCHSTVHLDYISNPEVRTFYIHGEKGTIDGNLVSRRANLYCDTPTEPFKGHDTWNDNYIEEMQAFIDRIDGKQTIGCSGKEGLEVLKICLEVRKQAGLP